MAHAGTLSAVGSVGAGRLLLLRRVRLLPGIAACALAGCRPGGPIEERTFTPVTAPAVIWIAPANTDLSWSVTDLATGGTRPLASLSDATHGAQLAAGPGWAMAATAQGATTTAVWTADLGEGRLRRDRVAGTFVGTGTVEGRPAVITTTTAEPGWLHRIPLIASAICHEPVARLFVLDAGRWRVRTARAGRCGDLVGPTDALRPELDKAALDGVTSTSTTLASPPDSLQARLALPWSYLPTPAGGIAWEETWDDEIFVALLHEDGTLHPEEPPILVGSRALVSVSGRHALVAGKKDGSGARWSAGTAAVFDLETGHEVWRADAVDARLLPPPRAE